jgi:hypothetical protein
MIHYEIDHVLVCTCMKFNGQIRKIIQFICFEMHMDRSDIYIFFNYINFNYQSVLLSYVMADFQLERP